MGGCGDRVRADPARHLDRLVQRHRRFSISAHRVNEGTPKSKPRLRVQVIVATALGRSTRAAKGFEPYVDCPRSDRGLPRVELPARSGQAADRVRPAVPGGGDDLPEPGDRCRSEIASQEFFAGFHSGESRVVVAGRDQRSEEHTSELQSQSNLVCRLLLEKKKKNKKRQVFLEKKNKKKNIER